MGVKPALGFRIRDTTTGFSSFIADGPGLVADMADFVFAAFGDRYHGPAVFAGDGAFWGAGRLYERSFDGAFVFFIHYR